MNMKRRTKRKLRTLNVFISSVLLSMLVTHPLSFLSNKLMGLLFNALFNT